MVKRKTVVTKVEFQPWGRPRKWKEPEEIWELAEEYFKYCYANGKPLTITGLALALGTTRQTIQEYSNNYETKFHDVMKKIKQIVENYAEEALYSQGKTTGAIFFLKNFGWTDKTETEINIKGIFGQTHQELLNDPQKTIQS